MYRRKAVEINFVIIEQVELAYDAAPADTTDTAAVTTAIIVAAWSAPLLFKSITPHHYIR